MDAANVDLKAFTDEFYVKQTGSHLQPVLDTLKYLRQETKVWVEITTLLIPGLNDSAHEIGKMSEWIAKELGVDVPLHFTAFHPDYKMTGIPATPAETLIKARQIAHSAGLLHVCTRPLRWHHALPGLPASADRARLAFDPRLQSQRTGQLSAVRHGTGWAFRAVQQAVRTAAHSDRDGRINMSTVHIPAGHVELDGELILPPSAKGVVLFAHGSGSSRFSPRNTYVAEVLQERSIGTLLFDLLTREEDQAYETRFDIELLTQRLLAATAWLHSNPKTKDLSLGYFGASTGAAAALQAAAKMENKVSAVVSRGGRPDLAGADALSRVTAPTLLIVGGADYGVIELNQQADALLHCKKQLTLIPGATHLFEEPGTLQQAAKTAAEWFVQHL
jgi:dienelactone hydrolase